MYYYYYHYYQISYMFRLVLRHLQGEFFLCTLKTILTFVTTWVSSSP